jgi:hypothetical protein
MAGFTEQRLIALRRTLARPRADPVQSPGTLARGYPSRIKLALDELLNFGIHGLDGAFIAHDQFPNSGRRAPPASKPPVAGGQLAVVLAA